MTWWADVLWRAVFCAFLGYAVGNVYGLRAAYRNLQRTVSAMLAMKMIEVADQARQAGMPCPGCSGEQAHTEDCAVIDARRILKEHMELRKAEKKS